MLGVGYTLKVSVSVRKPPDDSVHHYRTRDVRAALRIGFQKDQM